MRYGPLCSRAQLLEKTDTAQIRSDSAASDRVSEEERKSPVSAGQRERPAPPVLESSSEVGLEESEAAPDIVSSDDEIMIFGSDDIEDEFGAMMPTIQQICDAEPVSPAAGRGSRRKQSAADSFPGRRTACEVGGGADGNPGKAESRRHAGLR